MFVPISLLAALLASGPASRTVEVPVAPDAAGAVAVVIYDATNGPWLMQPPFYQGIGWEEEQIEQLPDDGIMGSSFFRLGAANSATGRVASVWPTLAMDRTAPGGWSYRMRVTRASDAPEALWFGLGVGYTSEGDYQGGPTNEGWPAGASSAPFGSYGTLFSGGNGTISSGEVFEVEGQWDGTGALEVRVRSITRSTSWSDWVTGPLYPDGWGDPEWTDVVHVYGQLLPWSPYFMTSTGFSIDVANLRMWGRPVTGVWDYQQGWTLGRATHTDPLQYGRGWNGFDVWGGVERPGYIAGATLWPANVPGITVYDPVDNRMELGPGAAWRAGTWTYETPGYSAGVGGRLKELRLILGVSPTAPAQGTSLVVRVRNAVTGALIPDSQIPGNSAGLKTGSPGTTTSARHYVEHYWDPAESNNNKDLWLPPLLTVPLYGVPAGTSVYLEVVAVHGATPPSGSFSCGYAPVSALDADSSWFFKQPMLCAAWVVMDGPFLDARRTVLDSVAGTVRLDGARASASAAVTITPSSGSAGAVTYDGNRWTATVTGATQGSTALVSEAGGTSMSVALLGPPGLVVKSRVGSVAGALRDRAGNAVGIRAR